MNIFRPLLALLALSNIAALAGGAGKPAAASCLARPLGPVSCVWPTAAGKVQIQGTVDRTTFTARDAKGRVKWQETMTGVFAEAQKVGTALAVVTVSSGAITVDRTTLLGADLGPALQLQGNWLVTRPADALALFSRPTYRIPQEEDGFDFYRVTLAPKLSAQTLHFPRPSRPNCGEALGVSERFGQAIYTARHVYVRRKDDCGLFMTRYDWVTPDAPPLVYALP